MLNSLAPSGVFCHVKFTCFLFIKNYIDFLHQIKIKWNNYIRFFCLLFCFNDANNKRAPLAVSFSLGNCFFINNFHIFTSTEGL